MKGHKDAIYDFVLDQDCEKVYSAGADGYVVQWNLSDPDNGNLVLQLGEAIYSVGLKGDCLMVGTRVGDILSIDLKSKNLISREKTHKGGVFITQSDWSGGEDGVLFPSSSSGGLKVSTKSLRCAVETDLHLYIGASDSMIYKLDKISYEIVSRLEGHTNSVFALELLDGETLISTGRDATIRAWDLTIDKEVHSVPAHEYQAKSLSWNGDLLLSSSMDKTIKVWSSELNLLKVIDFERYHGHTNCINKVKWIDQERFISCSDDRTLVLWKVEINS